MLAFLPVITIGILFGLAMDYEVFLMSRIHEEYSKTGDNDYSIKVGLKVSCLVIVAAALIMFSVFFAFVFQEDVMIKSMGMALAFGVLFDAFVVNDVNSCINEIVWKRFVVFTSMVESHYSTS